MTQLQSHSEQTSRIAAVSIIFDRAEGPIALCTAHEFTGPDCWRNVEQHALMEAGCAPASGGYDKCDITIRFADGFEYRTRYDMVHRSLSSFEGVARYVWREWAFYAGTWIPSHMTREQWERYVATFEIDPAAWADRLRRYQLGREPFGVVR